jgi:hypothetical protein
MLRRTALRRGRAISILVAAGVGYLFGSWNAASVRSAEPAGEPTAAQAVALRFPRGMSDAPVLQVGAYEQPAASAAPVMRDEQLALFAPEPMLHGATSPQAALPGPAVQAAPQPAPEQTADIAPIPPVQSVAAAAAPILPKRNEQFGAAKLHPASRQASRPARMLDDAQIASIRRRLHLTSDQERMWPAVEAALRNIALEREHEERGRSAPTTIDPNSREVQDLKSAAIPLIMSFSDDQKDEVRDLARGMGLDQLASQF